MKVDRIIGRAIIVFVFVAGLIVNVATSYNGPFTVERNYGCAGGKILHDLCATGEQRFFIDAALWLVIIIAVFVWNERRSTA